MGESFYQTQIANIGKEVATNFRAVGENLLGHGMALSKSLKGYIPPQWGRELVMLKVSNRTSITVDKEINKTAEEISEGDQFGSSFGFSGSSGGDALTKTVSETFFFDAVMEEIHTSRLTITQHPVQSGASLTDHAFLEPRELTLEVRMSDVMGSLVTGQYASDASKSVSAYRKFCELQEARSPLVIQTRLKRYENMLLESITAPDTKETKYGLKCTLKFREVILGEIVTGGRTGRIHAGGIGSGGTKKGVPVSQMPTILRQIEIFMSGGGF